MILDQLTLNTKHSICRCSWCEGECDTSSSIHISSPDRGESRFCSDQCFSLHRRQVYRQSDRKQNSHVSDRKQNPHVSVPRDIQKPRLSVKPDHLLKMTTREKQRTLRHSVEHQRRPRRLMRPLSPVSTPAPATILIPPPPPPQANLPPHPPGLPLLPPPTLMLPLPIFIPIPIPIPLPIPVNKPFNNQTEDETPPRSSSSLSLSPSSSSMTVVKKEIVEAETETDHKKVLLSSSTPQLSPRSCHPSSKLSPTSCQRSLTQISEQNGREEESRRKRRAFIMDQ